VFVYIPDRNIKRSKSRKNDFNKRLVETSAVEKLKKLRDKQIFWKNKRWKKIKDNWK
jgi:hypothetical protein